MKQLYLLLITLVVSLSANAEESGTCGKNLKWKLTSEGVLTITGTGEMTDYSNSDRSPWYGQNIKRIIIEDGVSTIGKDAFSLCGNLTSVTIPNSVWKSHTNLTHPGKYFRPSKVKIMRPTSPK